MYKYKTQPNSEFLPQLRQLQSLWELPRKVGVKSGGWPHNVWLGLIVGPRLTAQLLVFGRTPPGSAVTSLPPSLVRAGQATHAGWVRRMAPPPGYMPGQ